MGHKSSTKASHCSNQITTERTTTSRQETLRGATYLDGAKFLPPRPLVSGLWENPASKKDSFSCSLLPPGWHSNNAHLVWMYWVISGKCAKNIPSSTIQMLSLPRKRFLLCIKSELLYAAAAAAPTERVISNTLNWAGHHTHSSFILCNNIYIVRRISQSMRRCPFIEYLVSDKAH